MREAGLTDVACEELNVCLPILGTPEVAADLAMAIGPAARVVRLYDATPTDAKAIRDEIAREMEAYRDGDQVRIPAILNIYTARTV